MLEGGGMSACERSSEENVGIPRRLGRCAGRSGERTDTRSVTTRQQGGRPAAATRPAPVPHRTRGAYLRFSRNLLRPVKSEMITFSTRSARNARPGNDFVCISTRSETLRIKRYQRTTMKYHLLFPDTLLGNFTAFRVLPKTDVCFAILVFPWAQRSITSITPYSIDGLAADSGGVC